MGCWGTTLGSQYRADDSLPDVCRPREGPCDCVRYGRLLWAMNAQTCKHYSCDGHDYNCNSKT
eukprot:6479580-Amphidinium_carterae.1